MFKVTIFFKTVIKLLSRNTQMNNKGVYRCRFWIILVKVGVNFIKHYVTLGFLDDEQKRACKIGSYLSCKKFKVIRVLLKSTILETCIAHHIRRYYGTYSNIMLCFLHFFLKWQNLFQEHIHLTSSGPEMTLLNWKIRPKTVTLS